MTTNKNERVKLEMKVMRYKTLARHNATTDPLTEERIKALIAELEQQLREIDE